MGWSIVEELRRPDGIFNMKVTEVPPKNAPSNWFEEIAEMGKDLEKMGGQSPLMLRLQPQDPQTKNKCNFSVLPTVRAGDCAVDMCAICFDDVSPEDVMVQLPCKHAFHAQCAARWLTQSGKHSQGKRQCCPLCCRRVVSTPDGCLGAADS